MERIKDSHKGSNLYIESINGSNKYTETDLMQNMSPRIIKQNKEQYV